MTINLFLEARTLSVANGRNSSQTGLRKKGHSLAQETRKSRGKTGFRHGFLPRNPTHPPPQSPYQSLDSAFFCFGFIFRESFPHSGRMTTGNFRVSFFFFFSCITPTEGGLPFPNNFIGCPEADAYWLGLGSLFHPWSNYCMDRGY